VPPRAPRPRGPIWQRAAAFAAKVHLHQVRKDGHTPYFSHPARVALTVSRVFGCDDDTVIAAALLHDTIEDTQTDYDDIAGHFGRAVADCVAALTKNMILPENDREHDYYSRLRKADWRARLVKIADAYDNFCDRLGLPDQRRKARKRLLDAIALVGPDAGTNAPSRRAVAAARALLRSR
jgi:guanosine-3',5'-bis(diphosphate) 3'-pyrophosphohydrolase